MTKTQRKELIITRKNELTGIRDRLPGWGSYAKDIVKYLSDKGVDVNENQVYIAVKTGMGARADYILAAMKALSEQYERKLKEIATV